MSKRESTKDPAEIKESLDELVQKLEQAPTSSSSWSGSVESNKEEWDQLKEEIKKRQSALKQLVTDKKAGLVGVDEFDIKYHKLQDELTELEMKVYNMRLGTDVK